MKHQARNSVIIFKKEKKGWGGGERHQSSIFTVVDKRTYNMKSFFSFIFRDLILCFFQKKDLHESLLQICLHWFQPLLVVPKIEANWAQKNVHRVTVIEWLGHLCILWSPMNYAFTIIILLPLLAHGPEIFTCFTFHCFWAIDYLSTCVRAQSKLGMLKTVESILNDNFKHILSQSVEST